MKHIIIIAALFAATFASAQSTRAVLKNKSADSAVNNTITESLTIGSGKTLTIASGATINATGATITGFTASASFADITGAAADNASLSTALGLKATLADPTFTGAVLLGSSAQSSSSFTVINNGSTSASLILKSGDGVYNSKIRPVSTLTGLRTVTLPDASGTVLFTDGSGASLTGITPSQLAQASATSGQVLTWSGSAWAPATATGGVTSITGTANQITVTGTTTPTLSLPATITGLTSVTSTTFVGGLTGLASLNLPLAGGTLTGALTLPNAIYTGLSLTGSQATNTLDVSTTWNTTGAPSLIYGRATNTASGAAAKLIDLGTAAGGELFCISKTGAVGIKDVGTDSAPALSLTAAGTGNACGLRYIVNGSLMVAVCQNTPALVIGYQLLRMGSTGVLGWSSSQFSPDAQPADLTLARDAAHILAQRNGTNAQAYRLYETDSGSNDEYLEFSAAASVNTIKPAATGTGTASTVRYYTTTTVWFGSGSGTPEASQTAGIGSVYTDTATGTLYRKTSGTGNTGWVTP